MEKYKEFYEARKIIDQIMQDDFVGPVTENEILKEIPTQYYIMGKLYPQQDQEETVSLTKKPLLENTADDDELSLMLCNENNPSALGVTFVVDCDNIPIAITVTGGQYTPIDTADGRQWQRKGFSFTKVFSIKQGNQSSDLILANGVRAKLSLYKHIQLNDGSIVLTAALSNQTSTAAQYEDNAERIIFQTKLKISAPEAVFTEVDKKVDTGESDELLTLEMLYLNHKCYAQGHGCATDWDKSPSGPRWVSSEYFPKFDDLQKEAKQIDLPIFSMKYLAGGSPDIIDGMNQFMDIYEQWISNLKEKLTVYPSRYHNVGKNNIKKCQETAEQIRRTISLLEKSAKRNDVVWKSFRLANEAMLMQRVQSFRKNNKTIDENKVAWYPFQLAFILHEIISFIRPEGNERKKVDLLWFPTGGGKTEAYLGIAAFAIFLRRLRNPDNDGVSVIMRYTLRLLTSQQFERASMMIIACELLREREKIGGSEIGIGLWVGESLTPNKLKSAKKALYDLSTTGSNQEKGNPMQVLTCPWCGVRLSADDYAIDETKKRMLIHCPNADCKMHGREAGLPIHLIDDDIYANRPTFIVATVDKFAQLPLNSNTFSLFQNEEKPVDPPELIIQDELHLISGPLGSIVGIYEAAITKFCEKNDIPVKIIASTATIRNAKEQITELYAREYTQFPPQGISADDSFFAVTVDDDVKPTREYCGVMGIGLSMTTIFVRVNAVLTFASKYLIARGFSKDVIDNYWTIVDYFNTLRELGGSAIIIVDDVHARYTYLCKNKFLKKYPVSSSLTDDAFVFFVELTSRKKNTEIVDILQDKIWRSYNPESLHDAYNFILASNMISVGVDVGRLGCMVVEGQPKTNAEYIQSTSRVGRANPGLIVTIYNPVRSRDRSHYEQFMKYHSSLYRYVEASSLTPFSDRARDRGLQALFVSLCRYYIPEISGNLDAGNFNKVQLADKLDKIKSYIVNYVKRIDAQEADQVLEELDEIIDEWQKKAETPLAYIYGRNMPKLIQPDTKLDDRFRMMNSMRSVGNLSGIYLKE